MRSFYREGTARVPTGRKFRENPETVPGGETSRRSVLFDRFTRTVRAALAGAIRRRGNAFTLDNRLARVNGTRETRSLNRHRRPVLTGW